MRCAIVALAAILLPLPAAAQQVCLDRTELTERLKAGFGERLSADGLQGETFVVELWHSPDEGTWTILLTHANGTSCILAAGTDWLEALPGDDAAGLKG